MAHFVNKNVIKFFKKHFDSPNKKIFLFRYRVALPVSFIQRELAFDKAEDWSKFIEPFALKFTDGSKSVLDCKASMEALSNIQ
jgi:hypothetical protein